MIVAPRFVHFSHTILVSVANVLNSGSSRTGVASIFGFLQLLFPALVRDHCLGQRLFAGLAFQDAAQSVDGRGARASRHFHGWNIPEGNNSVNEYLFSFCFAI
jgi:hypothetical protein